MTTSISIPSDEDGFVLLQCHLCGEYFKMLASDVNDESVINIWCPYCGLNGKKYVPKEAIEIGLKIAENEINDMLYDFFKGMEKQTKNSLLKFKCTNKPNKNVIPSIKVRTDKLEIKRYGCCKSTVKITPLSKMCGSYCPICGGIDYE